MYLKSGYLYSYPNNFRGYRFSFNGMEKDNETYGDGNAYDFGARIYDARLGRFLSIDPLTDEQTDWSPFKAFFDNPMVWSDPDGETEKERITAVTTARAKIGTSYSELDCSALVEKAARSAGIKGLKSGSGVGGWKNGVAMIAGNSRKIDIKSARVGDALTFKSGRSDHKGPNGKYDHIGIISAVIKDKDGNVTGYNIIHATSKGTKEQTLDLKMGLAGFELRDAYQWDTPDDQASTPNNNNSDSKTSTNSSGETGGVGGLLQGLWDTIMSDESAGENGSVKIQELNKKIETDATPKKKKK